MEIDGGPTPNVNRIDIDASMLIGVERHPKLLENKMADDVFGMDGLNKRQRRDMTAAGLEIPEYVPPPEETEADEISTMKVEIQRLKQKKNELEHELSLKKEEERERLLEAAPRVAVSPAARELAEKESVNLAEITGSGVNSRITLSDVRQAVSNSVTE
jgi:pyruvate/2-oxoglutarate dehydrogenase complex dihydrolipoamide acyltransferase (E2) component